MYKVILAKSVTKQIKKIPRKDQDNILKKIESLTDNPKPFGAKHLQGNLSPYYRVRCGDYRIVYSVENDKLVVIVIKIGHRKDIYD